MTYLWRLGWKETREQMVFWVAIAALAILLVTSIAAVFAPRGDILSVRDDETIRSIAVNIVLIMSVTYAVVCASMLFAGETETGTQSFLDALPLGRMRLWTAKVMAGFVLVLCQTSLLFALSMIFRLPRELGEWWNWFAILFTLALTAYAWGLWASVLCPTVLSSAGLSGVFVALSSTFATALAFRHPLLFPVSLFGMAGFAIVTSGQQYTRVRRKGSAYAEKRPSPSIWRVLVWLCWQQSRTIVLLTFIASLLLGILFPWYGLWLWPVATLALGALWGTQVFAGEQPTGVYRFLGEQRIPPGHVWLAKVLFCAVMAVGGAAMFFFIGVVACYIHDFASGSLFSTFGGYFLVWLQSKEVISRYIPLPIYFTLWLITGFSVGAFFSQLLRKPVVALLLSAFLSAVLVAVWLPSLLIGDLSWWKPYLPSLVLLAASRLAMRAWVSDRLRTFRPLAALTLCGMFVVVWTAGCLWYRVVSIPDVGEPFDVNEFVASLPSGEKNEAGRLIREAVEEFNEHNEEVMNQMRVEEKTKNAALHDEKYLDLIFQGGWLQKIEKASRMPVGMVDDPRLGDRHEYTFFCRQLADRAKQLLERGKPERALDHLLTSLRLEHHLRSKAGVYRTFSVGGIENLTLASIGNWLEKAPANPDLLRRLLDALQTHEKNYPPLREAVKFDYLRRHFEQQGNLLRNSAKLENKLVNLSRLIPWEREREKRLENLWTAGQLWLAQLSADGLRESMIKDDTSGSHDRNLTELLELENDSNPLSGLNEVQWREILESPLPVWSSLLTVNHLRQLANQQRQLRQLQLQTARKLYEAEHGQPPQNLQDLVPRYLPQIPEDPFTGQPLKAHTK